MGTLFPTRQPTRSPTPIPTPAPTRAPSRSPTRAPTMKRYTQKWGGNGGSWKSASCSGRAYINQWHIRSGGMVDSIQGRCSDGKWLSKCGGNGGSSRTERTDSQKISIRYWDRIDKFNGRGGNGGTSATIDCGSGYKI